MLDWINCICITKIRGGEFWAEIVQWIYKLYNQQTSYYKEDNDNAKELKHIEG